MSHLLASTTKGLPLSMIRVAIFKSLVVKALKTSIISKTTLLWFIAFNVSSRIIFYSFLVYPAVSTRVIL